MVLGWVWLSRETYWHWTPATRRWETIGERIVFVRKFCYWGLEPAVVSSCVVFAEIRVVDCLGVGVLVGPVWGRVYDCGSSVGRTLRAQILIGVFWDDTGGVNLAAVIEIRWKLV